MLREAARVTQLARLLQLSPAWGSPDVAEGRSLHPGHGKSPAPVSSPNCLGQKSCLGAASRAPQHPETPRGNGSFLPRHVPDPQPCERVHGRVPPQSALLREQQKPLAERLTSRNLYGEAVGSERSCTPQRSNGGGQADHAADAARPLSKPSQGQQRSSKRQRTKPPIRFPAQSARESQTPFFSAPSPCARCRCRDPRTEPGGTAPAVKLPTHRP